MLHFAVNWLAVIIAGLASMAIGAGWYMSLSRQWLGALGKSRDQLNAGPTPFIWALVCELIMAYFVAGLTPLLTGATNPLNGALVGAHVWLGFVMTTMILNHRYQNAKWSLTLIDGAHLLLVLVAQGIIIGLFG